MHRQVLQISWDRLCASDRYQNEHEQQGFLHAFILLRPTQTRNSGRAEQWIAGRGWDATEGTRGCQLRREDRGQLSVALFDRKPKDWIKCSYTQVRYWEKLVQPLMTGEARRTTLT